MRRVCLSATWLVAVAALSVTALAAQPPTFNTNKQVTLVMKGGDRHSGTLVYHNSSNFDLIENGRENPYPIDDVAYVDFGGGAPATAELTQLPTSANPPELRRHMLVLNDGTVVHGKLYTIKENAITFDTQNRERKDFDISSIARMYISAPASRQLYAAQLSNPPASAGTSGQAVPAGAIQVQGNQSWTDTNLTVRKGDRLAFSTTGQITIRQGGETVGPDGKGDENRVGAPVPTTAVGSLIGRVGTGQPFAIGSNSQPITMPATGRLYLGVNDAGVSDNSGAFIVTIVR